MVNKCRKTNVEWNVLVAARYRIYVVGQQPKRIYPVIGAAMEEAGMRDGEVGKEGNGGEEDGRKMEEKGKERVLDGGGVAIELQKK